ncbi:MAG: hypothetical protein C4326_05005 [Ignavibacteria bacterium]
MRHEGINWLAIIVAAIIPMVLGGLWYSNVLFAKQWMAAIGKTEEEIRSSVKNPAALYAATFVASLVAAYVIDNFVYWTNTTSFLRGMKIGAMLSIGVFAVGAYQTVMFEFRRRELYTINTAYNVVCIVLMGGLLAVWR